MAAAKFKRFYRAVAVERAAGAGAEAGFGGAWLAGHLHDLTGSYDLMWWLIPRSVDNDP